MTITTDHAGDEATRRAWEQIKQSDTEDEVQQFLERHVALLPGAWGDIGPGGHHGPTYSGVFRQPPLQGLDAKRVPDFMWITRSTIDITPICIEIERPTKRWFTLDGTPTAPLNQALDQLNQWRAWFSEPLNQQFFREQYLKSRWPRRELRPQFVLIYGRESDFTEEHTLTPAARHQKRRFLAGTDDGHLRTFDSLVWKPQNEQLLTISMHANGQLQVDWIPESFEQLGDPTGAYHLGSIDRAIANNPAITPERAAELQQQWSREREQGERLVNGDLHHIWPPRSTSGEATA
ncbi:MAG: Shedu anti-phage system protein SduA domain-containing protein [Brachybacterium sp.]